MKKLMMAMIAVCAALGAYAEITIGTSNNPKAGEVNMGHGLYCLVFSNVTDATVTTFTPSLKVKIVSFGKMLEV